MHRPALRLRRFDDAERPSIRTANTTSSAEYRLPVLRNAIHILGNLERFDQQLALDQVVDRLNQWVHLQKFNVDWKVDPFMDSTLPKQFVGSPWVAQLQDELFNHEMDGEFLEETTWLRDISNSVHGDKVDDHLSTAEHLFDWTIRNIQLVAPPKPKPGQKTVDVSPFILGRHSPSDVLHSAAARPSNGPGFSSCWPGSKGSTS